MISKYEQRWRQILNDCLYEDTLCITRIKALELLEKLQKNKGTIKSLKETRRFNKLVKELSSFSA